MIREVGGRVFGRLGRARVGGGEARLSWGLRMIFFIRIWELKWKTKDMQSSNAR